MTQLTCPDRAGSVFRLDQNLGNGIDTTFHRTYCFCNAVWASTIGGFSYGPQYTCYFRFNGLGPPVFDSIYKD